LYWTIQWQIPAVFDNAKNQFTEMFQRDKNRAAVILWSLANETPLSDARLQFLTNYAKYIRSLDDTRLLTAALEIHTEAADPNTIIVNDPLGESLDVLGCNEYLGWYGEALPPASAAKTWKTIYNKPLIMSEFGAGALAGKHGEKTDRWTEEFQASFFEENIAMLKKIPFLRGTTPWILVDFRSPKRPLTGIQDYYNRKGLISEKGEKKQAFFLMKQFYNDKNK
jgi:beta-glucuronidase